MPENLKALRLRIRSVKKTKKITRAMEMVSAAKLRKTENVMKSMRPFLAKVRLLIGRLALSTGAESHPLFQKSTTGYPLLVVFTSDRGLCGAFNANILKTAKRVLDADPEARVLVIGRKGRDYMRRNYASRTVDAITDLGGNLDGALTDSITERLRKGYLDGVYRSVTLVYPNFISTAINRPVVEQFLPFDAAAFGVSEEDASHPIDYLLEPSPERVFDAVLPRYLKSKLFITLAETFTSEHSSRMMAMNNATKNCDELTGALTLRLNKARQAAITTEIIEIVSGANAL
jgi:F-type H+-transporting ATPase subunit gamma